MKNYGEFIRQNVNPWLAIALIGLMAFWTILFYLTHKAQGVGQTELSTRQELLRSIR